MSASAPYWGDLPDPRQAQAQAQTQAQSNKPTASTATASATATAAATAGAGPNLSTTSALLQPKPNRASTQTTNTEAPTEPAFTPYASPTSAQFPGLAPRPPSLAYNTELASAARAQQQHIYQGNDTDYTGFPPDSQDQYGHYAQHNDDTDPLPAAPEVPRGPPSSYRPPNINTATYG